MVRNDEGRTRRRLRIVTGAVMLAVCGVLVLGAPAAADADGGFGGFGGGSGATGSW
ncbi:hypothetical protein [Nonomuraea sp. NPDC005650]|uniref:hypothetical protein n=1 Tax=Nonomuraea sp. NPDC005650 TaxID=3157045 RepID=UPI0033B4A144